MEGNEINVRFTHHVPVNDQPQKYEEIREMAKQFAVSINALCPDSREKSLAITNLEQAVMWANAAIARRSDG